MAKYLESLGTIDLFAIAICVLLLACTFGVILYSIWYGIKSALQKELKERCRDLEHQLELEQRSNVQLRARIDYVEATAKLQMAIANMWQNAYLHELGAPTEEVGETRPSLLLIVSRSGESGRLDS